MVFIPFHYTQTVTYTCKEINHDLGYNHKIDIFPVWEEV